MIAPWGTSERVHAFPGKATPQIHFQPIASGGIRRNFPHKPRIYVRGDHWFAAA
jgi:hypothetical protein